LLGALVCVQVAPEFVEVKTAPPEMRTPLEYVGLSAATNLAPSAEEATEVQLLLGALVCVQVAPEFVEV
jgi:hypothetical protein